MELRFRPRPDPLPPAAVALPRVAVTRALDRLAERRLVGVATDEDLIVVGAEATLPWLPGARYFGRAPEAPSLLLPTLQVPTAPLDLVARALVRAARSAFPAASTLQGPWLLEPLDRGGLRTVALDRSGPLEADALREWCEEPPR